MSEPEFETKQPVLSAAELHCHTRFSDGAAHPAGCVRAAARRGLSILAITDHNTAEGGLPYWQAPLQQGVLVIPGEEISTDRGHLLAYFIHQTVPPGPFERVLADVRRQGGLAFMAHPYHIPLGNRWRRRSMFHLLPAQLALLDGIEVENGHNRAAANALAWALAGRERLRAISGSDAHYPFEIGNARTLLDLDEFTLSAARAALCQKSPRPQPRRASAALVYYWVGIKNRLSGQHYAWRDKTANAA
jgi:predicted metal-dependent phosphoesterase TrpH